jgi:heat shock protein HslJ
MKNIVLFAVIVFVSFITACSNSKKNTVAAPASTIITDDHKLNGSWRLTYISGPKITLDGLFPNKKPTLVFKLPSQNISGNGGCNGYGGEVKIEGHNINFSKIMHTMMACDGITGENQFFNTLENVTAYSVNADTNLVLLKGDTAMMRFVKQ